MVSAHLLRYTDFGSIGFSYETTEEFDGAPETRYGITYARDIQDGVTLSLEYLHDEYSAGFGGGADSGDAFTLVWAYEF